MTVILAALTGYAGGRMLWLAMRKSWSRQAFLRTNYQGASIPTAAGIVLALTLLVVEAARAVVAAMGIGDPPGLTAERAGAFVLVLAFATLGLLDDLVGTSGARGFNGHFQALARGELTSGMIKVIGGAAAAIIGASLVGDPSFGQLIINAGIIALTANFFNLLDVRPGRSTKTGLALFAILLIVSTFNAVLVPVAIVVGAAAAMLLDDLHERLMLGDTGANALGAAIGLGLITQVEGGAAVVTLAVLIGLNALSEFVSFTKIIETVPPLRMLDQLGRRRPPVLDLRDDRFDAGALNFEESFRATNPRTATEQAPIHQTPPARGNVGGARDGDRTEPAPTPRAEAREFETELTDAQADLFSDSDEELFARELNDREFVDGDLPHRHN